ncbi:hypothetical protein IST4116A_05598 [Burkholderia cenocepacia]|nr:hypothetical protein IST4112_05600 [Burkholderia cenocepacia]CAB5110300.1 hypothetical protein IST4113_05608 [Burkholderia cenocepacia]CAB5133009.1 hypothetical protein IST4134_05610 [Burkholderia cenocepacia]CAB5135270.1 hypothetical protein IST4129_05610 [Burkholderia cenocepacia]CAB5136935.1 hypothetical protein IST4116B_05593 [Burkholderia cenocepacia]
MFISNCRRIRSVDRIFLNFQLIMDYAGLNGGFLAAYGGSRAGPGTCLDFVGRRTVFSEPA